MKKVLPVFVVSGLLFLLVIFSLSVSGPKANAASDFTPQQAQQFVASLPVFAGFVKKMRAENRLAAVEAALGARQPEPGYHPSAGLVSVLREMESAGYNELAGIVGKYGFVSPENWAKTADSVNLAYLAIKFSREGKEFLNGIASVTPEMEAAMQPQERAQFENAKAFIDLLAAVPDESIKIVKTYVTDIDRAAGLFAGP